MSIEYSYEVLSVDEANRCMEVKYTAAGYDTIHVSARLPFSDERLEDVIALFAPMVIWVESKLPVSLPAVGVKGTIVPPAQLNVTANFADPTTVAP